MTLSPEIATLLRAALLEAEASGSAESAYAILDQTITYLLPPLCLSQAEVAVHVQPNGMFVSYLASAEQAAELLDLPW